MLTILYLCNLLKSSPIAADQNSPKSDDMSFLQHLEVLRWHLVRSAASIIIFGVLIFIFKDWVFENIIYGPKQQDFPTYRALCWLSGELNAMAPDFFSKDGLCIGGTFPELYVNTLAGKFLVHLMLAMVGGIIASMPYILWELWRFIKPALRQQELRYARGGIWIIGFLFITGALFGYYLIAPLALEFLFNYGLDAAYEPTLSSYISTISTLVLGCGFAFELPVLAYFLAKIGMITSGFLRKYRRHAAVGCLILASILTPPDILSQLLVTGPLLILYEVSIRVVKRVEKKRNK